MYNKIDYNLLKKINILSRDKCVDIIVHAENSDLFVKKLKNYSLGQVEYLSIINAYVLKTKFSDLINVAKIPEVEYVSGVYKVCSLINRAKEVTGIQYLPVAISQHSCVIIDTGVYPHIDFCLGNNRLIKFVDLINQNTSPYDDNGHGTVISGILGACSIMGKYSGIDNRCNIIVIKALDKNGETTSAKILTAMQWVLENKKKYNIRVVCMSFGSDVVGQYDPLIKGVDVLWDNGIVVVTAGGNGGPEYETIMSPGASKKVITVGSVSYDDKGFSVAEFSSRGPIFGVFKPDLVVPGVNIISTNVFSNDKKFYTKMSGTSVSAPIVAGVASRLIAVNPNYTPNQIKYIILKSCVPITGDRNSEGYGRLDLSKLQLI